MGSSALNERPDEERAAPARGYAPQFGVTGQGMHYHMEGAEGAGGGGGRGGCRGGGRSRVEARRPAASPPAARPPSARAPTRAPADAPAAAADEGAPVVRAAA